METGWIEVRTLEHGRSCVADLRVLFFFFLSLEKFAARHKTKSFLFLLIEGKQTTFLLMGPTALFSLRLQTFLTTKATGVCLRSFLLS